MNPVQPLWVISHEQYYRTPSNTGFDVLEWRTQAGVTPTSRHSVQDRSTRRPVKAVVSTDSAPDLVISSKYWETVSLPVGSHGLNGQHPDVDCTLRGRVNQNDREQR